MAGAPPTPTWVPLLHELVATELASEQAYSERVGELVAQLRTGGAGGAPTPVVRLVEALGPFLTSDNDAQRARATGVLAEVVEALPAAAATPAAVKHLTDFFAARLTDWPAVRGALRGSLALISRSPLGSATGGGAIASGAGAHSSHLSPQAQGQDGIAAPQEADVVELMRVCVSHVFIRALAQPDRMLALRLLCAVTPRYGTALLGANLDLLEYLVSSVDGEKDPRCLLLCFEAVQALLALYHAQPEESLCHERLEESAEELFEVLACYFPVTFSPPPGDPNRITREDLAAGLQASLAAEPLFAPFLVPLAMEKLSSALRQAKLDSLALLAACATGWGPAPLASHVSTLWLALRAELVAPAAEGLLPADVPAVEEVAAAAADCLARCLAAFQRSAGAGDEPAGAALADAVLADPSVQDMLACITSPGQDAAVHRRSALRTKAGARAAQALRRAGGHAAAQALAQLLPPLLSAVRDSDSASRQSQCLGWAAVVELLQPTPAADAAAGEAAVDADLLQQTAAAAAAALTAGAAELAAAAGAAMGVDSAAECGEEQNVSSERWALTPGQCTLQHATQLQLAAVAALFGSSAMAAGLQQAQVDAAVTSILQVLAIPAGALPRQLRDAAVAPLAALASSTHSEALAASALPQLVVAAGRRQTAGAALAALQALAAASGSLQADVLRALDGAIQQQLTPAAEAAAGEGASSTALLLQLLHAATSIVSAAADQPLPQSAAQSADAHSSLLLAQHLLEAAEVLPASAAAAASPEVQSAGAELAYHAMRAAASGEQQQPLAAAAAAALAQQGQQPSPLHACVASSLLVPLRPEAVRALPDGRPAELVQTLLGLALAQQQEGSPAGYWASLAAAALLNKWPADADSLSVHVTAALQGQLHPACGLEAASGSAGACTPPADAPAAWACLAAVVRALAMRGHRDADAAIACTIASLDAAAQRWNNAAPSVAPGQEYSSDTTASATGVRAAAQFLGAVLEGGTARPGVGKQSFASCKPLWQQRLYTTTAAQLLPLLQRSMQASAHAVGGQAAGAAPLPATASAPLLLALGHLLQSAPGAVLQQDQGRLLPWLLQALSALQEGSLSDGPLLHALLLLLSNSLMGDAGRRQAEQELLPRLVPTLLGLARYRPSAAVRETALQCLLLLLELPYTALHPYRREVARVLAAAVDDNRRSVRLQAARVRQAWGAA